MDRCVSKTEEGGQEVVDSNRWTSTEIIPAHTLTHNFQMQAPPARHWCGTINYYRLNEWPSLHLDGKYDYLIEASEVGETGNPHIQFYVSLKRKCRLTALKKLLKRAHLEPMMGTPKQASDYCKKEGFFRVYGELSRTAGEATQDKWKDIHDLAKADNQEGFYEAHPQQAFLNANKFKELTLHYQAAKAALPLIDARWYIGPSGSGKSLAARTEYPELYLKPSGTKWWPNYNGQQTVLLDDLSKTQGYMLEHLKNWADHYPFVAETKGGHTNLIRPVRIIVTTQYHWDEMTMDSELRAAIARRFTVRTFGGAPSTQDFIYPYGGFGQDVEPDFATGFDLDETF